MVWELQAHVGALHLASETLQKELQEPAQAESASWRFHWISALVHAVRHSAAATHHGETTPCAALQTRPLLSSAMWLAATWGTRARWRTACAPLRRRRCWLSVVAMCARRPRRRRSGQPRPDGPGVSRRGTRSRAPPLPFPLLARAARLSETWSWGGGRGGGRTLGPSVCRQWRGPGVGPPPLLQSCSGVVRPRPPHSAPGADRVPYARWVCGGSAGVRLLDEVYRSVRRRRRPFLLQGGLDGALIPKAQDGMLGWTTRMQCLQPAFGPSRTAAPLRR